MKLWLWQIEIINELHRNHIYSRKSSVRLRCDRTDDSDSGEGGGDAGGGDGGGARG
jgi:hypothetical protein